MLGSALLCSGEVVASDEVGAELLDATMMEDSGEDDGEGWEERDEERWGEGDEESWIDGSGDDVVEGSLDVGAAVEDIEDVGGSSDDGSAVDGSLDKAVVESVTDVDSIVNDAVEDPTSLQCSIAINTNPHYCNAQQLLTRSLQKIVKQKRPGQ